MSQIRLKGTMMKLAIWLSSIGVGLLAGSIAYRPLASLPVYTEDKQALHALVIVGAVYLWLMLINPSFRRRRRQ